MTVGNLERYRREKEIYTLIDTTMKLLDADNIPTLPHSIIKRGVALKLSEMIKNSGVVPDAIALACVVTGTSEEFIRSLL